MGRRPLNADPELTFTPTPSACCCCRTRAAGLPSAPAPPQCTRVSSRLALPPRCASISVCSRAGNSAEEDQKPGHSRTRGLGWRKTRHVRRATTRAYRRTRTGPRVPPLTPFFPTSQRSPFATTRHGIDGCDGAYSLCVSIRDHQGARDGPRPPSGPPPPPPPPPPLPPTHKHPLRPSSCAVAQPRPTARSRTLSSRADGSKGCLGARSTSICSRSLGLKSRPPSGEGVGKCQQPLFSAVRTPPHTTTTPTLLSPGPHPALSTPSLGMSWSTRSRPTGAARGRTHWKTQRTWRAKQW